ncbi:MAG: hypothetical protein K2X47_01230 [Bdellovibrionales bacterium]|nr:hypothetical protein [Bdellovibrionales bacterium]
MKLSLAVLSLLSLNYLVACGSSSSSTTTSTPAGGCSDSFVASYNSVTAPLKKITEIQEKTWLSDQQKKEQMVPHVIELHSACRSFYATQKDVSCIGRVEGESVNSTINGNNPKFKPYCDTVIEAFAKGSSSPSTTPTTRGYGTTTTTYGYGYTYDYNSDSTSQRMDAISAKDLEIKVISDYSVRRLLLNPKNVMVNGQITTMDAMTPSEKRSAGTYCRFVSDTELSEKLTGYPTLKPLVISDSVTSENFQQLLILMDNGVGLACLKPTKGAHTLKEVKAAVSGILSINLIR